MKKLKINEEEAGDGPFLKNGAASLGINVKLLFEGNHYFEFWAGPDIITNFFQFVSFGESRLLPKMFITLTTGMVDCFMV